MNYTRQFSFNHGKIFIPQWCLAIVVALCLTSPLCAQSQQMFYLARQSQGWEAKEGVMLRLMNQPEQDGELGLDSLRLEFAVGNGKRWFVLKAEPSWTLDERYEVVARLENERAELWINGDRLAEGDAQFAPASGQPLVANRQPSWASRGRADYMIVQESLVVSQDGANLGSLSWEQTRQLPMRLRLFKPIVPKELDVDLGSAEAVTLAVSFRLERRPNQAELAPFIDRYGQAIAATFPTKVQHDEQLRERVEEEAAWLASNRVSGYDRFGGNQNVGWSVEGTGYFRTLERDGYWWLISPEGNPCFYRGVCVIPGLNRPGTPITGRESFFEELPPRGGRFEGAWFSGEWGSEGVDFLAFHTSNMIRRYGDDWANQAVQVTAERLKAWGFSGAGKWSSLGGAGSMLRSLPTTPFVGHLRLNDVPMIGHRPDVFDPAVREVVEETLRKQIEPHLENPWVLGWSVGNEKHFIPHPEDIRAMLDANADVPVKRALLDHALEQMYDGDLNRLADAWGVEVRDRNKLYAMKPASVSAEDIELLRHYFSHQYFGYFYDTVKAIDPNHLYLGSWTTPEWWVNENDWQLIAPHCDVIGYDRYAYEFADQRMLDHFESSDKPVLLGEFGFPTFYDGERGYGQFRINASDDAEAGRLYSEHVREAAENRYCIGVMWFLYRDQPLTGRGKRAMPALDDLTIGEHYAFGLVDITDTPKWDLVEIVRKTNLAVDEWRLEASRALGAEADASANR